jgi:hypothetical protein
MPRSDASYGWTCRSGERPGIVIIKNYLDDRVRLFRDALVFPGFEELLKLGAVVAD